MFTLFHVTYLLGMIAGTATGAWLGSRWLGLGGLVAGAVIGFFAGAMIGQSPLLVALMIAQRKLSRMTSEELRDLLHSDDCMAPNTVLLELLTRGEDISIERQYLCSLLMSDDSHRRMRALAAMNSVFPELVKLIPNYQPYSSTEDCLRNAEPILLALNPAMEKKAETLPESPQESNLTRHNSSGELESADQG